MKVKMSLKDFEAIESYSDPDYLSFNHFEKLLNPFLREFEKNYPQLSQGQKVFYCLSTLGGQISNGGIHQFFYNKFDLVKDTRNALKVLNEDDLLEKYEKAYSAYESSYSIFKSLKRIFFTLIGNHSKAFIEDKKGLDFDWFDDYFYQYTKSFEEKILNYVKSNPSEFIE